MNKLFLVAIISSACFIQVTFSEITLKELLSRETRQSSGSCGRPSVTPRAVQVNQTIGNRIIGGMEAKPHSFPWIVSLRSGGHSGGSWHFCGGSLIRSGNAEESDIVVTAAHCLESCGLSVAVGAHYLNKAENGEQLIRVAQCIKHEQYNPANWYEHDIAVMKLERPVKFTQNIQPVCLPSMNVKLGDNVNGIVAGWGYTKEGGPVSENLLQVTVPTVDHKTCNTQYYNNIRPNAHLCVGYTQGGKGSCQGDSGGPYVINTNGVYTLHGLVSFAEGCSRANKPSVFARVSSYVDWINGKVRSLSGSQGNGGTGGTGGGSSNCLDNITYCADYKKDCNNADWMKGACKKTCGLC